MLAFSFHVGLASALFVTGFQPLLAYRLTGQQHPLYTASMLLLVWKLYLLDRVIRHPEDEAAHEGNAAAFVQRFQVGCWGLFAALALAQLWLVLQEPRLLLAIAVTAGGSFFYFVKVPLLGKRAKQVPYFKCFYLSACALVGVAAYTPGITEGLGHGGVAALILSFALCFLNFSLYDIKDVEADTRANIKTFAAALPLEQFLAVHVLVSLGLLAASLVLLPGWAGRVLALVCAFHIAMSLRLRRHRLTAATCGLIDGGYGLILGLGTLWLRP